MSLFFIAPLLIVCATVLAVYHLAVVSLWKEDVRLKLDMGLWHYFPAIIAVIMDLLIIFYIIGAVFK